MARGRPRAFDVNAALDSALEVFWRKGYEGASLPDLTKAMGINRPSLYAAFGNKEALFRKAMERYLEGPAARIRAALEAPTAREVAEKFLRGTIELITDPLRPRGCFLVQGALACGDAAECLRQEMAQRRTTGEVALRERFAQAITDGDLPTHLDPADLARYVTVIAQGLAVQASGGVGKEELQRVVDVVLEAWPASPVKTERKRK